MIDAVHGHRPKLLFLASPFPPYAGSASVRTWNIARYLVRLGWSVTVVTPHPSMWRRSENVEESDAKIKAAGIERILTHHSLRFLDPDALRCHNEGLGWFFGGVCRRITRSLSIDSWIMWERAVERACSNLTADDVDLILATGSPFAAFGGARRLSRKWARPYVLDYRDPWSGNPHDEGSTSSVIVRRERKLLAGSAAVTIVSPSWASALNARFGIEEKTHIVTNGYDPDELAGVKPQDFGHFAIVYTGTFYPPKRIISPLMAGLKLLRQNSALPEWRFHYYGKHEDHVRDEAGRFGITDHVVLHGNVPRAQALSAVRGAGVSVVITTVSDKVSLQEMGVVPAKVYEAIGLSSPTLCIAPAESDIAQIGATAGLLKRVGAEDAEGIAAFTASVMQGRIPAGQRPEEYAWTGLARKLDRILRRAAHQNFGTDSEKILFAAGRSS